VATTVELTFDGGPDPIWTPAVIAALRGSPLRATFFVVAEQADAHPELLAVARAEGHTIELQCHRFLHHTHSDRATIERDTERALAVLAGLGVHPRRWRTPGGLEAPWTAEIAAAHGLELCHWGLDTHDWRGDRAEQMLAAIGPELRDGAVVVLHDGLCPGALRTGCEETVRFARLLAAEAMA
jgi:peptidoglycan/xylan/chitin deacetylase (PgdA/CDA1 family)